MQKLPKTPKIYIFWIYLYKLNNLCLRFLFQIVCVFFNVVIITDPKKHKWPGISVVCTVFSLLTPLCCTFLYFNLSMLFLIYYTVLIFLMLQLALSALPLIVKFFSTWICMTLTFDMLLVHLNIPHFETIKDYSILFSQLFCSPAL